MPLVFCFYISRPGYLFNAPFNCAQRFAAWRRAGLLALMFMRSTNVEPSTNVSTKHETPPFAKPLLPVRASFMSCLFVVISCLSWCVGLVALLQNLALAWACAVLQMCHHKRWLYFFVFVLYFFL